MFLKRIIGYKIDLIMWFINKVLLLNFSFERKEKFFVTTQVENICSFHFKVLISNRTENIDVKEFRNYRHFDHLKSGFYFVW